MYHVNYRNEKQKKKVKNNCEIYWLIKNLTKHLEKRGMLPLFGNINGLSPG